MRAHKHKHLRLWAFCADAPGEIENKVGSML